MLVAYMGVEHLDINLCNIRHMVRNMADSKLNNVVMEINPHPGLTICRPKKKHACVVLVKKAKPGTKYCRNQVVSEVDVRA